MNAVPMVLALLVGLLWTAVSPHWFSRFVAVLFCLYILAAWLHALIIRRSISVERIDTEFVAVKGRVFTLTLLVQNLSFLPTGPVFLSDNHGALETEGGMFSFDLAGNERTTLSYQVTARARGSFVIGPVHLKGSDLLGLSRWEVVLDVPGTGIVYPSFHKAQIEEKSGQPLGTIATSNPAYEDMSLFRSVRPYNPGDELKRLNWKATARTGNLQTTEFERSMQVRVLLICNLCRDDYPIRFRESYLEKAIETCASLVYYYASRGQETALMVPDDGSGEARILTAHSGMSDSAEFFRFLAMAKSVDGNAQFANLHRVLPQLGSFSKAILVTARPEGAHLESVRAYSQAAPSPEIVVILGRTDSPDAGIDIQRLRVFTSAIDEDELHG